MAYDEGHAALMRDDLYSAGDLPGGAEQRMFGGLCFLSFGNMVCGVHKGGAMYRVGPDRYDAALALPGVEALSFTGRPMKGLVEVDDDVLGNDETRRALTVLAMDFAATLPPKPPKKPKAAKAKAIKSR